VGGDLTTTGIDSDNEVDIQADNGRVVIQVHERTLEQTFDKLLAEEPGAEELMALVKDGLGRAIAMTDETTARCYSLIEKLEQQGRRRQAARY